jgi:hypothetical protein
VKAISSGCSLIRLGHDRRLKKARGRDGTPMLNEVLGSSPVRFTKSVQLGRRQRERATRKQRVHPQRDERLAQFDVRAQRIRLFRAQNTSLSIWISILSKPAR